MLAFEFFDGVPLRVVPENLKSGVMKGRIALMDQSSKHQQGVDALFSQEAAFWAEKYQEDQPFRSRLSVVGEIVLRETMRTKGAVLDFGGGVGIFSAVASAHATHVVCADRSPEMLESGKSNPEILSTIVRSIGVEYRPEQVEWVSTDSAGTQRQCKGPFQLILAIAVLEYIEDVEGIVRFLADRLTEDGRLVVFVPNPFSILRLLRGLVHWLLQVGTKAGIRTERPKHYMDVRPHGSRVRWKSAFRSAELSTVLVRPVPFGISGWRRFFRPSVVVVAQRESFHTKFA